jgi:GntR family transcriptional regulator
MQFQIDASSRVPIYRQLADQIREAVARGQLAQDEKLPSVRELSKQLTIKPNTVDRVYTELEREGVLNTRPGLGVFVAETKNELTRKVRRERLVRLVDQTLTEAVHLGFTRDEATELFAERSDRFQWSQPTGAP